jgi:hypothetical protein
MAKLDQIRSSVLTIQRFNLFDTFVPWHVNCSHYGENGSYGRESANNENAAGDSGLRRNDSKASPASPAWSIPGAVAVSCDSNYCDQAETHHRCGHARPCGYSTPGKDHSLAPSYGALGICARGVRGCNSRCTLACNADFPASVYDPDSRDFSSFFPGVGLTRLTSDPSAFPFFAPN